MLPNSDNNPAQKEVNQNTVKKGFENLRHVKSEGEQRFTRGIRGLERIQVDQPPLKFEDLDLEINRLARETSLYREEDSKSQESMETVIESVNADD